MKGFKNAKVQIAERFKNRGSPKVSSNPKFGGESMAVPEGLLEIREYCRRK